MKIAGIKIDGKKKHRLRKLGKASLHLSKKAVNLGVGFATYAYHKYDRSTEATLQEYRLRASGKKVFTDHKACTDFLAKQRKENDQEYFFPAKVKMQVSVAEKQFEEMKYFVLNQQERPEEIVFFFPGGVYVSPISDNHWKTLDKIAKATNACILVPMYQRAPKYHAKMVYPVLTQFYEEQCNYYQASSVSFLGDSAGGGMALALAQKLAGEGKKGPEEVILLSPWLDASMENQEMEAYEETDPVLGIYGLKRIGKVWAGTLGVKHPWVSPIYGSIQGLGHLTIFVGTREIFYPEVIRFDEMLKAQEIEHTLVIRKGMNHVWMINPIPEALEDLEQVEKIIGKKDL